MLMTILTQTFFTLVRGHLMSLMLLSVWHNCKILKWLVKYCLLSNLCEELAAWLECRDLVLGHNE